MEGVSMNYSFRNQVLWRWCVATFVVSLIVSVIFNFYRPWGWIMSAQPIWLIPSIVPQWLVLPITNTLFILTFVWLKTSSSSLNYFWKGSRLKVYGLACLQGLLMSVFCRAYPLGWLILGCLVGFLLVYGGTLDYQFHLAYERFLEKIGHNDSLATDEDESNFPVNYDIGSFMMFFYTIIVVYGLDQVDFAPDVLDGLMIFLGRPLLALVAFAALLVGLAIIAFLGFGLWSLAKKIGATLLYIVGAIIAAIAWTSSSLSERFSLAWRWTFPKDPDIPS